jgi:hypothetical protein
LQRHYLHTSLSHIGLAYQCLRECNIPRERIITIVQLHDFLRSPHVVDGSYCKNSVLRDCDMLLKEGGADYDYDYVNPGTIWNVMHGIQSKEYCKVIPEEASSIFFALYSHGDCHPTSTRTSAKEDLLLNPLRYEWFAHMPYATKSKSLSNKMLSFVATEGATGKDFSIPERYFYATQLRHILINLFQHNPNRPILAMLNYCRSGGALQFMQSSTSKRYYGAERSELYIIISMIHL